MANLRQLMVELLSKGRVDSQDMEHLRRELYADGKIDREEADFLVELHKRIQRPNGPAWEDFFYKAIKDHILADGSIDAEEAAWLRQMLWQDGQIDDRERKFLHELHGEARQVSPEFQSVFDEAMRQPMPSHTSGGGHRGSPPRDRRA